MHNRRIKDLDDFLNVSKPLTLMDVNAKELREIAKCIDEKPPLSQKHVQEMLVIYKKKLNDLAKLKPDFKDKLRNELKNDEIFNDVLTKSFRTFKLNQLISKHAKFIDRLYKDFFKSHRSSYMRHYMETHKDYKKTKLELLVMFLQDEDYERLKQKLNMPTITKEIHETKEDKITLPLPSSPDIPKVVNFHHEPKSSPRLHGPKTQPSRDEPDQSSTPLVEKKSSKRI